MNWWRLAANLLIIIPLSCTFSSTLDTTPPQVFNCPMEDVRGSQVATTSGTSLATWNTISAFDLDSGATPAHSSMSLYGQTTSTQFPYGFTTVGYEFIDNAVPPQNIALCTFLVAIPGKREFNCNRKWYKLTTTN